MKIRTMIRSIGMAALAALALGWCVTTGLCAEKAAGAKPQLAKPQAAKDTPAYKKETVWSLTLKGGIVMIPLGICSIVGLAVAIERAISLRRSKVIPPGFVNRLMETFNGDSGSQEAAIELCEGCPGPVGVIFKAGIQNHAKGEAAVERAIEEAGAREVDKMKRSLRALQVVVSVSPLLGLLGTVYGMITAFETSTHVGLGKGEVLAHGIYEALVTTAAGLTIAIPALLIYQYFASRVDGLVDEIDEMGIQYMSQINFGEGAAGQSR